jgi:hypothetical protein
MTPLEREFIINTLLIKEAGMNPIRNYQAKKYTQALGKSFKSALKSSALFSLAFMPLSLYSVNQQVKAKAQQLNAAKPPNINQIPNQTYKLNRINTLQKQASIFQQPKQLKKKKNIAQAFNPKNMAKSFGKSFVDLGVYSGVSSVTDKIFNPIYKANNKIWSKIFKALPERFYQQ